MKLNQETEWEYCSNDLKGPFIVTLKENGCAVFAACVGGNELLVTSKNAFGPSSISTKSSHADKAKEWLLFHLKKKNVQEKEMAEFLKNINCTAVFEVFNLEVD